MPTYEYPRPAVTVDSVIFRIRTTWDDDLTADDLWVCLIQRGHDPYAGCWALPGGFVDEKERSRDAALRELKEEAGIVPGSCGFLGVYDTPGRDPRGWTISLAYYGVAGDVKLRCGDDAVCAAWYSVKNLPNLAFDHKQIIEDAVDAIMEPESIRG